MLMLKKDRPPSEVLRKAGVRGRCCLLAVGLLDISCVCPWAGQLCHRQ